MYSKIKRAVEVIDKVVEDEEVKEEARYALLFAKRLLADALEDLLYLRGCMREWDYVLGDVLELLEMRENGSEKEEIAKSAYVEIVVKEGGASVERAIG